MIVSLNWLKKFTKIDKSVDDLVKLIGSRLVEIEQVIDLAPKYKGILVAQVVECDALPDSDHLHITKLDDGGVAKNVERDGKGLVQVVCGAPNVTAGQKVAWLPPETIVPETYGKENIRLEARKLRGVISYGMIASASELDLFDEHSGILVLDDDMIPGKTFAESYELNDVLLDIENKSLTHRPDCFGIIGFAREVAAIQSYKFENPDGFDDINPDFGEISDDKLPISARIDDKNLAARYQAIVVSGTKNNCKSPLLVQTYLARVGVRPINALVDVTNYLMLLSGQPLHAFDYDKLVKVGGGKAEIHVRGGKSGEKLELLDGKTIELADEDIVIAAGDTAIGLAGAMGGANTAIDENTRNIVLESATFNLYNLRGTQMRHGIFSEAITRFTKGQPTDLTAPVLKKATDLVGKWADGKIASEVVDCYSKKHETETIKISQMKINSVLGSEFSVPELVSPIVNAGFNVEVEAPYTLVARVPWWRKDVHIGEDVVEEIARIYGYDNIHPELPSRDFVAVEPSEFDTFRSSVRSILARAGANEVLTYSFVHGDMLEKAGLEKKDSYKIVNSISPKLQYYRQTLLPSLLDLVHMNVKQGYDKFALFELNKVHHRRSGMNDEGVPIENNSLALVATDQSDGESAQYYLAKRILEYLSQQLSVHLNYHTLQEDEKYPYANSFEPRRSAKIVTDNQISIGVLGEFKRDVTKDFKLPSCTAGFELDSSALFDIYKSTKPKYKPISHYPAVERDVCFKVGRDVAYVEVEKNVIAALESCSVEYRLEPVDIFSQENSATKNITLRLRIKSYDRTLTKKEARRIVDHVVTVVQSTTDAEVI